MARKPLRMGLINQLVPKEELEPYTYRLAEEIASLAPLSHAVNKITLNQVLDKPSIGDLTPEEAALPLAQFEYEGLCGGIHGVPRKTPAPFHWRVVPVAR